MGLEGTLYTFNTCLEDYVFDEPGVERELPPGSLPALHTLSLRAVLGDTNYHDPGPLPEELSALTGLTSLTVEGPAVELQTIEQWKEQHYDTLHRYHSTESDSDTLQQESLESHMDAYDPLPMPGSRFCLPHLRELNLLSCGLERVPKFVAGEGGAGWGGGGAGRCGIDDGNGTAMCCWPRRRVARGILQGAFVPVLLAF